MGGTAGARKRARVGVGALALVVSVLGAGLRLTASSAAVTVKTYYVNPTTGNDANSGLAGAPWKTYHQMLVKIGDGTVTAGDTVLMAPGFYRVYDSGGWRAADLASTKGSPAGGTATNPVTISVDTSLPGDVEIDGAAPAGSDGNGPLAQARKCTGGTELAIVCDTDNDCPNAALGACTAVPGVYYIDGMGNAGESTGKMGGVAFERGATPGADPKLYETLYSPPPIAGHPIKMPAFTTGHNQFWPYIENRAACVATHDPWYFCTAAASGTSTRGSGRAYIQTASGMQPTATYVPIGTTLSVGGDFPTPAGEIDYVAFTNSGNGRKFHFWWGVTNVVRFVNAQHVDIEDATIQYNAAAWARAAGSNSNVASGSTFPRDLGGPQYLVLGTGGAAPRRASNITFRRTKIAYAAGDENIHWSGGTGSTPDRDGFLTLDHVEDAYSPWAVPNGQAPNASSVAQSWPPAGYSAYASYFPTHWSPLGGGGQSPGAFIVQTNNTTVRDSYFHDVGQLSFREMNGPGATLFERNIVDLGLLAYGAPAGQAPHPSLLVTQCDGAPTGNCGGFDLSAGLVLNGTSVTQGDTGFVVRNNVFRNVYGASGTDVGCHDAAAKYPPATANQFVNNTIDAKGDGRYGVQNAFQWGTCGADLGTASVPMVIKNNIFVRDTAATGALVAVGSPGSSHTVWDNNLWGATNNRLAWSGTSYTTLASWKAGTGQDAHAVGPVDPQFVQAQFDLRLGPSSPAIDAGATVAGFATDLLGVARPQGAAWDIGAYEYGSGSSVSSSTTSTTTTTSSTSTTTTVPKTTTTSTTTTSTATTTTTVPKTTTTSATSTSTTTTSTTTTVPPSVPIGADPVRYWEAARDGRVFGYHKARTCVRSSGAPVVAIAGSAGGAWTVTSTGTVRGCGRASLGSVTATLRAPIVGIAPTASGRGYWLVASDGGIFSFGDARFWGSTGALPLNRPIVGMAASPTGMGYWLVASDGGIFSFGDARFWGSTAAMRLNSSVVGMAASPTGMGYWLVGSDGGVSPSVMRGSGVRRPRSA